MNFVMLVGVPGSGKSTLAKKYAGEGWKIHSSDRVREELYGSEETQGKAAEVFQVLVQRARKDLASGRPCVLDATNLRRKRRMQLLSTLSGLIEDPRCILVLAEPDTCEKHCLARDRVVSREIIDQLILNFEPPYYYEGWKEIRTVYTGERYTFPRDQTIGFSQDNPYHSLTLDQHLTEASRYCRLHQFSEEVQEAAWYHDIGKLYTKKFFNKAGLPTLYAHFYDHEACSAYLYLCEKAQESASEDSWRRALYIASLISWHMRPMTSWDRSVAARARDRKLIGEHMYAEICQLHEADLAAHGPAEEREAE